MEVIGAIDVRKLYSILVCVLLITTVFAGCIGEVQEGSYSEDVGAEDHDHADHSDHDHGEEDHEEHGEEDHEEHGEEDHEEHGEMAAMIPTFEILSEHPRKCMNDNEVVTKFVDVFGVYVIAPEDATDEYVLHTANVLAQYIDNDEDGVPDDPKVLDILVEGGFVAPVWKSDDRDKFWEANRGTPCEDGIRTAASVYYGSDSSWAIGGIEKSYEEKGVPGPWDTNIEEIWHIVSSGWYEAYPEYFGDRGDRSSKLTVAMDTARGGYFRDTPKQYPDGAWYTYDCGEGGYGCQVHEYFYWIVATNIGALDPALTGKCVYTDPEGNGYPNPEWGICTREELEQKDVLAFELLNDYGFNLPTVIPDGSYKSEP